MRWKATTNHREVGLGASFHIYVSPQLPGARPNILPAETDIEIEFVQNWHTIAVHAIRPSRDVIVIETPDGAQWKLSPWTSGDQHLSINVKGMYGENWVVREQVK